uniref:Potassium channel toxin n=1 Tax=Hemiscorpius lepturus TaxID=520031 RepID=A0A1L4BJ34_HEMLE|nr:potassium channel toxin [Hemiscorpius lepturus]
MNKVACYILICVMVLYISKIPFSDGVSAGCPMFQSMCSTYCKKGRYGSKGRCIGPDSKQCKCYV